MHAFAKVCVCVLAAGRSQRMGAPKLTAPFAGTTLLDRALDAACAGDVGHVAVVTGANRSGVQAVMAAHASVAAPGGDLPAVCEVHNAAWEQGQGTSVAAAVRHAAAHGFDALLLMVADQPFLSAAHLQALVSAYAADHAGVGGPATGEGALSGEAAPREPGALSGEAAPREPGALPGAGAAPAGGPATGEDALPGAPALPAAYLSCVGERCGNPCLFDACCYDALMALDGDEGARAVLRGRPGLQVARVPFADALLFEDADTPADFARLERLAAREATRAWEGRGLLQAQKRAGCQAAACPKTKEACHA